MRLKLEQLPARLQQGLLPVYFISGDEPLQQGEAADAIRLAAKQAGYLHRETLAIPQSHDWSALGDAANTLSLFAEQKLIDLRLPSGKPGAEGSKYLLAYCQQPPPETVLLITSCKIDSASQKAKWFQAIDKVGAVVQVWPLKLDEVSPWLQKRAQRKGMALDAAAARYLAARVEGNLLAADQELEKLYLLHGASAISAAMIEAEVSDSSRFDVFKLSEAVLIGDLNRALKILNGLQAEGLAAPVVLWELSRMVRAMLAVQYARQQRQPLEPVYNTHKIWEANRPLLLKALGRLTVADVQALLSQCAVIDRQIKGRQAGDAWESLVGLCLLWASPHAAKAMRF